MKNNTIKIFYQLKFLFFSYICIIKKKIIILFLIEKNS